MKIHKKETNFQKKKELFFDRISPLKNTENPSRKKMMKKYILKKISIETKKNKSSKKIKFLKKNKFLKKSSEKKDLNF